MYTGKGTIVVKSDDKSKVEKTQSYERVWFEAPSNVEGEEIAVNATVKEGGVKKKIQVGATVRPKLNKEFFQSLTKEQIAQLRADAEAYFDQQYAEENKDEGVTGEVRLLMAASYGNDLWTRASYQKSLRGTGADLGKQLEKTAKIMAAQNPAAFPTWQQAFEALKLVTGYTDNGVAEEEEEETESVA